MSCRVLIIPEDPVHDQYILRPLVSRLLRECGKANASVEVVRNPRVRGFEHACSQLPNIRARYSHYDLLLFLPDADGKDRAGHFLELEAASGVKLLCCAAIQEVEAWLLAGHLDRLQRPWGEVRPDVSVKEHYFEPFLREFGDRGPGGGRTTLMAQTLENFRGLLNRCPELAELQQRICDALA